MNNAVVPPSPRPTSRHPRAPAANNALPRPQSAAIRGAARAFISSPQSPHPTTNASNGQNGALAAAAAAGIGKKAKTATLQTPTPEWHAHLRPKSAPRRVSLVQDRVNLFEDHDVEGLHNNKSDESTPTKRSTSQSPSHLAAKLAAQRSTPLPPTVRATNHPVLSPSVATDSEAISRIALDKGEPVFPPKITTPPISPSRSTIVAPKPIRPLPSKVTPLEAAVESLPIKAPRKPAALSTGKYLAVSVESTTPKQSATAAPARAVSPLKQKRPTLPPKKSSTQSNASWRSLPPDTHPQPLSIQRTRRVDEAFSPSSATHTSSSASFYSTNSRMSGSRNSSTASLPLTTINITPTKFDSPSTTPPKLSDYPPPAPPRNQQPTRPLLMRQSTGTTVDSLSSAIVASSVAASRATSPTRSYRPPPPPSRRHRSPAHHSFPLPLFAHHTGPQSRSRPSSPPKPHTMKTTMRQRSHSSDSSKPEREKRYHKHNHLIRKAPNKHHEGSRARWRNEVPEAARKRYEGVWAANKGLLLPCITSETLSSFQSNSDIVVNVVVRDIWSRSRLQDDVLEEVWDLVDRKGAGVLFRDEFVVGMWLIDQTLKGRKLPGKVGESVWDSVRYLKDTKIWRYKQ
jgi:hypothetical protein